MDGRKGKEKRKKKKKFSSITLLLDPNSLLAKSLYKGRKTFYSDGLKRSMKYFLKIAETLRDIFLQF